MTKKRLEGRYKVYSTLDKEYFHFADKDSAIRFLEKLALKGHYGDLISEEHIRISDWRTL